MADPIYAGEVSSLQRANEEYRRQLKAIDARLERVERERDQAKNRLQLLEQDNDSLRAELQHMVQAHAGLTDAYHAARSRLRPYEDRRWMVCGSQAAHAATDTPDPCCGTGG